MNDYDGRVVLITGSGTGIGEQQQPLSFKRAQQWS